MCVCFTPAFSRSFWLLQGTIVSLHLHFATALPLTHLHSLSWLSSTFFNLSCHTCYSLLFFLSIFPHFAFSLCQREASSECRSSLKLSICIFTAWRRAIILPPFQDIYEKHKQSSNFLNAMKRVAEPCLFGSWCKPSYFIHFHAALLVISLCPAQTEHTDFPVLALSLVCRRGETEAS